MVRYVTRRYVSKVLAYIMEAIEAVEAVEDRGVECGAGSCWGKFHFPHDKLFFFSRPFFFPLLLLFLFFSVLVRFLILLSVLSVLFSFYKANNMLPYVDQSKSTP
jgi:hypothetical protein